MPKRSSLKDYQRTVESDMDRGREERRTQEWILAEG
jgi:hypothetical protein